MSLEKAKKKRSACRTAFTKAQNEYVAKCRDADEGEIAVAFRFLENKATELDKATREYFDWAYDTATITEEQLNKEQEDSDVYSRKFVEAEINERARKTPPAQSTAAATTTGAIVPQHAGDTLQLPRIEIVKFDGSARNWLTFWSVFEKIHENSSICKVNKFQYLSQSMAPGSRAAELLSNYTPTDANYDKVIQSLKQRFGRDDLQIEIYVRDLLQLVLQNAVKTSRISLASLYDKLESYLRALDSLGVTTEKCAAMLYPMVESSLPEELLRAWQRNLSAQPTVHLEDSPAGAASKDRLSRLIKFIEAEVQSEERIIIAMQGFELNSEVESSEKNRAHAKKNQAKGSQDKNIPSATGLFNAKKEVECLFCDSKDHFSDACSQAAKWTSEQKQELVKKKRACFKCCRIGHGARFCRSKVKCDKCGRNHVTLMCRGDQVAANNVSSALNSEANLLSAVGSPRVFLPTLRAFMRSTDGTSQISVRVLFDSGSENTYITARGAKAMQYKPIGMQKINHLLFGGQRMDAVTHNIYQVHLAATGGNYTCNFAALEQEVLCEKVPMLTKGAWCRELDALNIRPADVFYDSEELTILVGSDISGKLKTGNTKHLQCGLTAEETHFGWVITGKNPEHHKEESAAITATSMYVRDCDIRGLWELDVLGIKDPIAAASQFEQEEQLKAAFLETVKIGADGRYEVELPFFENHPQLSDNKCTARRRLETTMAKLKKTARYEDYDAVFQEWLNEGVIERVPEEEADGWGHYIPHRPVIKENSTTPVRPVFDASAKEKGFPALNDCLQKGPNLIELIPANLLRFRRGNIGVIADIRKAFLQIGISVKDRNFLRFFWFDKEGNIVQFRHCRVVFGVRSSPFILGMIILYHLNRILSSVKRSDKFGEDLIMKLIDSFYVDNCVTSVDSLEELRNFIKQSKSAMELASFDLRGWEFNGDNMSVNRAAVLGIIWHKELDKLSLNVPGRDKFDTEKITKRNILAGANKIFDPLGLICAVTLVPRLLLQETCAKGLGWDVEVDVDIGSRYRKWINDLEGAPNVQVPRCILGNICGNEKISLHTFGDASKHAYAAVTFIRVERGQEVRVNFVQAKARVAPAKGQGTSRHSIPRLELLAATIGVRLSESILKTLDLKEIDVFYWSDSTTVLAWICRQSNWGTFVYNRVQEIRKFSAPGQWRHVPGLLNPADLPSRGCSIEHLVNLKWWEGPSWLKEAEGNWPGNNIEYNEEEINSECKKVPNNKLQSYMNLFVAGEETRDTSTFFEKYSSYAKLLRIVGWVVRFIENSRSNLKPRKAKYLCASEINNAEVVVLKFIQSKHFLTHERITHLEPFTDENGLIRIKTKIIFRKDNFNFKCPIVLPVKDPIVKLIIREYHENNNHAGVQILLSILREKFWVLGGRKPIRSVIRECAVCQRHNAKPLVAAPAPLPENRVRDAAVFEIVGIDFAGPIYLKGSQKAYICIFTCAVFRAVHLELVNSLNVPSLLMALRRFIARRGRPSICWSDNGTNFTGLSNLLKKIDFQKIAETAALQSIDWKFNPPSAPWWGGFWERLIGVLKNLLRRTLKKSCLDYEEMLTVLLDCEAIINARPITFVADGKDELVPLTPSHFLQEIKEIGSVDLDKIEKCELGKRYMYRITIKTELRNRFRNEYLGALVHHHRKCKNVRNVNVGDIVLIEKDNAKRMDWPIARVKSVIPGKDGNVRVLRLITATGELVRPVQRVHPLELDCEELIAQDDANEPELRVNEIENSDVLDENESNCENELRKKDDVRVYTSSGREIKKPRRLMYFNVCF